ncbi:MAG: IS3 family transposase [Patescibacteria group bacterium]
MNKKELAKVLGVSRSLLYYQHKQKEKDWKLKQDIEKILREFPSYGHKRIAMHLKLNKKRILRAMKLFGIKPYRRRGKKWRQSKKNPIIAFSNLLLIEFPKYLNQIWVSDFTYLSFKGRWIYLATIMDLFNREIVGFSIMTNHSTQLVIDALLSAINKHPIAYILHSDQGSEYLSKDYIELTNNLGIRLSMSAKGSPWENGYQESFYSQFKVDLGDPNRSDSLGELVYEIYQTIHKYNNERIHTTLKMSPTIYANQFLISEFVSNKMGT